MPSGQTGFLKGNKLRIQVLIGMMSFYWPIYKNNHAIRVIDVFFVPRACHGVARQSEVWSRGNKVCIRLRGSRG